VKAFAVLVGVVAALVIPGAAWANTVGTATTSSGQTLTISIDSPDDGVTENGSTTAGFSGHVSVSGSSESVSSIAVGIGDAYEAPGSTYSGNAGYYGGNSWDSFGKVAYTGTQKLYATAIASDGTRATANITLTLDPLQQYRVIAFGALYDWRLGGPTGNLSASLSFDRQPPFGTPIDFFVRGVKVCTAPISAATNAMAVCSDPVALAKAIQAGGYEARYEGSAYAHPASDTAGLIVQKP
jgi:hypothetical protein